MTTSDTPLIYRIRFTDGNTFFINDQEMVSTGDPDADLDWVLEQVAAVHAGLQDQTLRVEIIDSERLGGLGTTAIDVPYGRVLTGADVRFRMRTERTMMPLADRVGASNRATATTEPFEGNYERDFTPLWPQRSFPDPGTTSEVEHTEFWFDDDGLPIKEPYTPKEPLPHFTDDRPGKKKKERRPLPTWAKVLAGFLVLAVIGIAVRAHNQSAPKPYAQVCVNAFSLERLTDDQCATPDTTSRWWYVKPGRAVPAVGNFVDATTGSLTAPTEKGATADRGIPTSGRSGTAQVTRSQSPSSSTSTRK